MANGSPHSSSRRKIVSIGGGNGPYMVGDGLREKHVDITILSTPADSGGDSGRIRNEMGEFLPPGDIRRGMMALIDSKYSAQLRQWLDHRMDDVKGEKRSVGNFVISSAINKFGLIEGLKFVEWLCHVKGTVLPMSTDDVHLHGKLDDGTMLHREADIDQRPLTDFRNLVDVWLEPAAYIAEEAATAILEADLITIGPGDLFTSIAGAIKVKGVAEILRESKAVVVAIPSLMTKWSETRDYQVHDFVGKMIQFGIGRPQFDYTLCNNVPIDEKLLTSYVEKEKSTPMLVRDGHDLARLRHFTHQIHQSDLLSQPGIRQGLIRHDARKVAHALMDILYARPPMVMDPYSPDTEAPSAQTTLLDRLENAEASQKAKI